MILHSLVVNLFEMAASVDKVEGVVISGAQYIGDMPIGAAEGHCADGCGLQSGVRIALSDQCSKVESVHSASVGNLGNDRLPHLQRQGEDVFHGIRSEHRRAESTRRAQGRKAFLFVFAGNERPHQIAKFWAARCNHEPNGAIKLAGRVPAQQEFLDCLRYLRPYRVRGTENHLRRQHRIDLEGGDDRASASLQLTLVASRHALHSEEDRLFPGRHVQNVGLQLSKRVRVGGAIDHHALDLVRSIPFLKLLVLK